MCAWWWSTTAPRPPPWPTLAAACRRARSCASAATPGSGAQPTSACGAGWSGCRANGWWSPPTTRCPSPTACGACSTRVADRPGPGLASAEFGEPGKPVVDRYFGGILVDRQRDEGWEDAGHPHGTLLLARRGCLERDRPVRRALLRLLRGGRPRPAGLGGRMGGRRGVGRDRAQPERERPLRGGRVPHAAQLAAARPRALRALSGLHPHLLRAGEHDPPGAPPGGARAVLLRGPPGGGRWATSCGAGSARHRRGGVRSVRAWRSRNRRSRPMIGEVKPTRALACGARRDGRASGLWRLVAARLDARRPAQHRPAGREAAQDVADQQNQRTGGLEQQTGSPTRHPYP